MRIIGGDMKGRRIETPKGRDIRPTSDRAREAVFNLLMNGKPAVDIKGKVVVDVFAGTGALGLEAMSRGAEHVVFVDNSMVSLACLEANTIGLGVFSRSSIISADARYLARPPSVASAGADLLFVDPPYHQDLVVPCLKRLADTGWIGENGLVVAEMESNAQFECPLDFGVVDSRTYGAAKIVFLYRV